VTVEDVVPLRAKERRGRIVRELPEELYLETTNRCNLRCRTCPQYFGMAEGSADMTPDRVHQILSQLPTVRRVVLHGIGEPLLNRELEPIIAAVKERGAYALFNTNGLLLRPPLVERLVRSGLDELRVSVDSASARTYRVVRGADAFERIVANLRRLAVVKSDLSSVTPKVSLWITGMRANILELPDLVRLAAAIDVSEVYLQRLVFSQRGLAQQEQALYGRADERELAAVDEAERLATDLGVDLCGSGEATAGTLLESGESASYRSCRRPWSLIYVTANGNVLPCCIAPFTCVEYEDIVLGNIFHQIVEEIWNGPRYRAWRGATLEGRPPDACAQCGVGWSL
jgi:radical SAM protein with 4Fe4S-binding SPASM domain